MLKVRRQMIFIIINLSCLLLNVFFFNWWKWKSTRWNRLGDSLEGGIIWNDTLNTDNDHSNLNYINFVDNSKKYTDMNGKNKNQWDTNYTHYNNVCTPLGYPANALSLWYEHINTIINITLLQIPSIFSKDDVNLSDNERRNFHTWIKQLMSFLTSHRLLKSSKSLPHMSHVEKIIQSLPTRKLNNQPLQILIMGGSVTKGHFCFINPINNVAYDASSCNWGNRLEKFINTYFGYNVIKVHNVAAGGTSTDVGLRIYKYQLYDILSHQTQPMDIIINAYSTNDIHTTSRSKIRRIKSEAVVDGLEDTIWTMNEEFIRFILYDTGIACKTFSDNTPIVLYLSDYVGNYIQDLKDITLFNHVLQQLTSYYDIMFVSYADAIRDISLLNPEEYWFTPKWMSNNTTDHLLNQIHHGMGGHLSIMWIFLFNILQTISMYCNELHLNHLYSYSLENDEFTIDGRPQHTQDSYNNIPLPPLSNGLTLNEILLESSWKLNSTSISCKNSTTYSNLSNKPCVFGWMLGTPHIFQRLPSIMKNIVIHNQGWDVEGPKSGVKLPKRGWAAIDGINSTFVMDIKVPSNIKYDNQNIKLITWKMHFFVMQSYGEKWEGSRIHVQIYSEIANFSQHGRIHNKHRENDKMKTKWELISETKISGWHTSKTSVTVPYELILKRISRSKNYRLFMIGKKVVRVKVTLIEGNYFKFMGMALCNYY